MKSHFLLTLALTLPALLPARQFSVALDRSGYWHGEKYGLHESRWPNGKLRVQAHYFGDVFHGEYRTWYESGRPYELRHFDHGRESGMQQSWTEEGELYLNYEVRDGRRFGLINARPCLPADADGNSKEVR